MVPAAMAAATGAAGTLPRTELGSSSSSSSPSSPSSSLSCAASLPTRSPRQLARWRKGFRKAGFQLAARNVDLASSSLPRSEIDGLCAFSASAALPPQAGYGARSLSPGGTLRAVVRGGAAPGAVRCRAINEIGNVNGSLDTITPEASASVEDIDSPVAGFQTLTAEITQDRDEFFSSETDGDPDQPSPGFASVAEAVEAIQQGKCVIAVDDEDRENEGDLILAASLVTPEAVAFMVKHCTGIICVGMKSEQLDRLNLPLMVRDKENEEALRTAFTVTVDARTGTTTGVSASDRAQTILALASPDSKPDDFRRPGHIFPLQYREGGVLKRAGHTEAAVDLATLAGLPPAGVLCELVDPEDGSMMRLPKLREFAQKHDILLISIADLVRYKRKREKLVIQTAVARLPTKWGVFKVYSYESKLDGMEHVAMVKGDIGDGLEVLVRVHSECLTGDIFGSARCDCGNQLAVAMAEIEEAGRGVLVYLRGHEGRGIGLGHKLRAYNLQDAGRDTVEANVELGLPVDSREYGIGAQILRDVGVHTMKLMTNNPSKFVGLKGYGLAVTGRVPVISPITIENQRYLETKRSKMGHVYGSDLPGSFAGLLVADAPNTITGAETEPAG